MNKLLEAVKAWAIIIGTSVAIAAFIIGLLYVTRVLPYGNDWRCIIAECRIVK